MTSRLAVGQRAGLEEDVVGDADLADVVQEEAVLETWVPGEARSCLPGEVESEDGNPLGVLPAGVVPQLEGDRKRTNRRPVGDAELEQRPLGSEPLILLRPVEGAQLLCVAEHLRPRRIGVRDLLCSPHESSVANASGRRPTRVSFVGSDGVLFPPRTAST